MEENLTLNEEKAKLIAEEMKPCSEDYYQGVYDGVVITLDSFDLENQDKVDRVQGIVHTANELTSADIVKSVQDNQNWSNLSSFGFWERLNILIKNPKNYIVKHRSDGKY